MATNDLSQAATQPSYKLDELLAYVQLLTVSGAATCRSAAQRERVRPRAPGLSAAAQGAAPVIRAADGHA